MQTIDQDKPLQLALPKGRMLTGVLQLLGEAGIEVLGDARGYRPRIRPEGYSAKLLKPQNIVEMLQAGSRDVGFTGADWVGELDGDLVEVLDTGLDPVRLVAAAPGELLVDGELPPSPLVIASEYEQLTRAWISRRALDATFLRSYGATEVFPPEDADCIVDNTATGDTLRSNGLVIVDELMTSSTRLYANRAALEREGTGESIRNLALVLLSVLEARRRVMIELNVPPERLDAVVDVLPCMQHPTIAALHGDAGYAVKAAVPRERLPTLIPELKARGGSDVVVSSFTQIVP